VLGMLSDLEGLGVLGEYIVLWETEIAATVGGEMFFASLVKFADGIFDIVDLNSGPMLMGCTVKRCVECCTCPCCHLCFLCRLSFRLLEALCAKFSNSW
jgi:hypothetical protein